jgi:hypothetical protein
MTAGFRPRVELPLGELGPLVDNTAANASWATAKGKPRRAFDNRQGSGTVAFV